MDTITGRMYGVISNFNEKGEAVVVDSGSKKQSFKVVSLYKLYTMIEVLHIKVYKESKFKPFSFSSGTSFYTGLCEATTLQ